MQRISAKIRVIRAIRVRNKIASSKFGFFGFFDVEKENPPCEEFHGEPVEPTYQVIFATSMIAPELDKPEYTVGEYYTRENKSLKHV